MSFSNYPFPWKEECFVHKSDLCSKSPVTPLAVLLVPAQMWLEGTGMIFLPNRFFYSHNHSGDPFLYFMASALTYKNPKQKPKVKKF